MARIVNIDDKLSFDTNPSLLIRGEEFEVNSDAETVLRIMGLVKDEGELDAALGAYDLMFSEADRKKLKDMKLPFKDLMVIIREAMNLILGESQPGEQ